MYKFHDINATREAGFNAQTTAAAAVIAKDNKNNTNTVLFKHNKLTLQNVSFF